MPDAAAIYTRQPDGIGRITLDVPGKPVNVLSRAVLKDLAAAVDAAEKDAPSRLLIVSGKPGSFIAGADIFELQSLSRDELDAYLRFGQALFDRIEHLPMPTVAVIDGACLGGGLELAMACDFQVAKPSPKPTIGLPETTLGLVPGWGGTVRLPRRVGAEKATELITTGRTLTPEQAAEVGLIDHIGSDIPDAAEASRPTVKAAALDAVTVPVHPPAPHYAISVIRSGIEQGHQAGLNAERAALIELRDSTAGQNLLRLFALKQAAKKRALKAAGAEPHEVKHIVVYGGGTMGNGIAYALLKAGYDVAIVEADAGRAETAWQRLGDTVRGDIERQRLSAEKGNAILDRADIGTAGDGKQFVEKADLVVEAISEDLTLKRQLFADLGRNASEHAVLATNTSSLSVTDLGQANGQASRVVGLHFFNPVAKMPLVEIVRAKDSSPQAVATAVAVALAAGKTPIVVKDAPGFVVNRVLMPYLSEAMRCVANGIAVEHIDAAVMNWGMPMGPLLLIDTIGLDVTLGIFEAMHPHCGERVEPLPGLRRAVELDHRGRKTGRGFYNHASKPPAPSSSTTGHFADGHGSSEVDLADRLILPMVNEAARVLEEGVVASADDLDLATILGLGVAGWRGGIARYADDEGPAEIVRRLEMLAEHHGERFEPSPLLLRAADEDRTLASFSGGAA